MLRLLACLFTVFILTSAANAQERDRTIRWRSILDQPSEWYGTAEATRIADNVLLYQNDNGGWPKNIEMARILTDDDKDHLRTTRNEAETTIDNGATHTQIRFLALVHEATGDDRYAEAARRGIEYLLKAQYENGGWPQFYPLTEGLLHPHHVQRRRHDRRHAHPSRRSTGKPPLRICRRRSPRALPPGRSRRAST